MNEQKFIDEVLDNSVIGIKMENGKPIDERILSSCIRKLGYRYMFRNIGEVQQFAKHMEAYSNHLRENFGKENK